MTSMGISTIPMGQGFMAALTRLRQTKLEASGCKWMRPRDSESELACMNEKEEKKRERMKRKKEKRKKRKDRVL